MNDRILKHFLEFSIYTNPGLYKDKLINDLPDNIQNIGLLVRKNIIHQAVITSKAAATS